MPGGNQVTITVGDNGTIQKAKQSLTTLKRQVTGLQDTKIKIEVDMGGFKTLTPAMRDSLRAIAEYKQATEGATQSNKELAGSSKEVAVAEEKKEAATKKSAQTQKTAGTNTKETTKSQKELTQSTKEVGDAADKAAQSWANFGTLLKYRAVHVVISQITKGFRDAIKLLHDVDDELVVVRKVSQATSQEIREIEEAAYSSASKYGVSAADYLESVAEFTRAGYRDTAASLAELSTKTQIVGDTTGEVSNQFLLAVDKAYKYNGAISDLSAVLDGANEIDNKYATSIAKLAQGMGIVAPVAAQMKVGVDELTAAIGTITAVTQRTGTEAARALRAIMLNIVGDTKTEIDEGVTWTTGEIAGLRDVIKQYAPEAYKAAQATGEIINPMEAIGGLAKSMKDGLLTEQQLMEMISDIGGKLRSSQLLALIQNWDMYQSMLGDYAGAVGSADREVENALDSWTRKSEILRNTWAEVVSETLDTRMIKGILDFSNSLLQVGGSLGRIIGLVGGLTVAFKGLDIIAAVNKHLAKFKDTSNGVVANLKSMPGYIGMIIAAISAVVIAIRAYQEAQEKQRQKHLENLDASMKVVKGMDGLKAKYNEIMDAEMSEGERAVALRDFHQQLSDEYGIENISLYELNNERERAIALMEQEANGNVLTGWQQVKDDYDVIQAKLQQWAGQQVLLSDDNISWNDFYAKGLNELGEEISLDAPSELYTLIDGLKEYGIVINELGEGQPQITLDPSQFDSAADKVQKLTQAYMILDEAALKDNTGIYAIMMERIDAMIGMGQGMLTEYSDDLEKYSAAEAQYLLLKNNEIAANVKDADSLLELRNAMIESSTGYDATIDAIDELLQTKYADIAATEEWGKIMGEVIKDRYKPDAFIATTREINQEVEALFGYSAALSGAAAAVQEFNDAVSRGEKGDALKSYASIYDKFLEHFKAGEFGSVEYQEAIKAFLPEEVLKGLDYDYEEAGKLLATKFWQGVFAENGEDHGVNFADILHEAAGDDGEIVNELGEVVAKFTELGDGVYNIAVDDFGVLADYLGVNEDVIISLFDAMGIFSSELINMDGALLNLARDTGALSETAEGLNQVNLDTFVSKLVEAGRTDEDIWRIVDAMSEMDNVQFYNLGGVIDDVKGQLDDTITKARDADSATQDLGDKTATPTITLDDAEFYRKVQSIRQTLRDLSNTTTRIGITTNAGGTDNAPGGLSLVNEEGPEIIKEGNTARIAGGGYPTVTYLEPGAQVFTAEETANILKGNDLFGIIGAYAGGTKSSSSSGGSLGGSANIKAKHGTTAKTSGTTKKTSSGGSTKSSGSSSSSKEKEEKEKEELERHKKKVTLLETELDLLEAQNKPVKEQVDKIHQIQAAIMDQINYMKSIGAEQADINKLYVEWYNWNDKIAKLQKDIYKDLDDAIDNELDEIKKFYDDQQDAIDAQIDALKEAKDAKEDELDLEKKLLAVEEARTNLANAQAERTVRMYNAQTGQWEWVANAKNVQSAQEALQKAEEDLEKFYEDAAYDAQIAALEAQKDALDDEFDSIKEKWQEILDALEEPAKTLEEVLSDIAKNATADMQEEIDALNAMLAQFGYAIPLKGGSMVIQNASSKYDSGGILSGLGGIKATPLAEGVLPPDLTAAMLSPQSNEVFAQRLSELRYLYGANGMPTMLSGGGSRIGSQHNGNVYTFGNITLSEAQARSTTVYELAQRSRNLALYRNVN